ncbi:MAG TPA: phosphatidylserine decarboxylase [Sulfuricurvum sp.]|nr:phosphatidylserine decarboxylase [Sulfuricurvum sp.]
MMIQNDTFILSKRGWLPSMMAATLFVFFTMTGLQLFQFISGAALIGLVLIFRNPERTSAINDANSILSSVDGVVLGIEEALIDDKAMKKVTVLNGLWDVSMLRAPFDGVVEAYRVRHGVSLPLHNPLSETLNEKAVLSFRSLNGAEVFIEHMSEQSCFPIAVDVETEQKLKEGSRYGFLAKGRTILYLPDDAAISVHAGSNVRAGESVIGHFAA